VELQGSLPPVHNHGEVHEPFVAVNHVTGKNITPKNNSQLDKTLVQNKKASKKSCKGVSAAKKILARVDQHL
jgi:hypothetical protein